MSDRPHPIDELRGEIRGVHVTPGEPTYTGPKRPMDLESYRQEQIFRGKREDALTQAQRDAGRLNHNRSESVANERPTDLRQIEMQFNIARIIER